MSSSNKATPMSWSRAAASMSILVGAVVLAFIITLKVAPLLVDLAVRFILMLRS